VQETTDTQN